jgi:hypothetical protein
MFGRTILWCAATAMTLVVAGCAQDQSAKTKPNPLLKGYAPWTAPATDTMVDLWYLGCTPEEFDRYWLASPERVK